MSSALAADLVMGAGPSWFQRDGLERTGFGELEYHSSPLIQILGVDVSVAGAGVLHSNGSLWVGAGIALLLPFGDGWFAEGSFMPGFYDPISERYDLGSALEFRSLLGVGRRVGPDVSVSIAAEHKSNGRLGDINPGVDAVALRLRKTLP